MVSERQAVHLVLLHFHLSFLQIRGKDLHQQKDLNSLYCDTGFIMRLWTWKHSVPGLCRSVVMLLHLASAVSLA